LALSAGSPRIIKAGRVKLDPPPARVLIPPAKNPATHRMTAWPTVISVIRIGPYYFRVSVLSCRVSLYLSAGRVSGPFDMANSGFRKCSFKACLLTARYLGKALIVIGFF